MAPSTDYQTSRRDTGRPDRDDRRPSGTGGNNFGGRSGDTSRDRDRRVSGRDDFGRRGDRFSDKSKFLNHDLLWYKKYCHRFIDEDSMTYICMLYHDYI